MLLHLQISARQYLPFNSIFTPPQLLILFSPTPQNQVFQNF